LHLVDARLVMTEEMAERTRVIDKHTDLHATRFRHDSLGDVAEAVAQCQDALSSGGTTRLGDIERRLTAEEERLVALTSKLQAVQSTQEDMMAQRSSSASMRKLRRAASEVLAESEDRENIVRSQEGSASSGSSSGGGKGTSPRAISPRQRAKARHGVGVEHYLDRGRSRSVSPSARTRMSLRIDTKLRELREEKARLASGKSPRRSPCRSPHARGFR
jgi:hypothetical protein